VRVGGRTRGTLPNVEPNERTWREQDDVSNAASPIIDSALTVVAGGVAMG